MSSEHRLKQIVEAALLAAGRPLGLDQLQALYDEGSVPEKNALREVLDELAADYADRGFELREVGSGFRIQVRSDYAPWVSRLFAERPPKYSRALLETLALIAYRQPITRGEIEDIRGVSVSTNIIKTLTEREWVRVVGHRDVPGKPALYATTKEFLDYFNLKGLGDLPSLAEIRDLDSINRELELKDPDHFPPQSAESESGDAHSTAEDLESGAQQETPATPDAPSGEADDLIEADPDGETDSGVMHRPHTQAEPPQEAFPEDLAEYASDGETDSAADLAIDDNSEYERTDEAK